MRQVSTSSNGPDQDQDDAWSDAQELSCIEKLLQESFDQC